MFHGSMVALVTPMLDDQIDEERLRALVAFHIDAGTQALVAAGTTGEAGTLTHAEKIAVIKIVIEEARERIPVIAGTAANATKACIELTQQAMVLGAHAALIMTPAYIKPTQEGLYEHYHQIAHEVAIPIILYNVPSRTSCDLLPETVARLAKLSNIVGIKDASGQRSRLQQMLDDPSGPLLDVYTGDDLSSAEWMLAGAKGVISVTANVAPRLMAKMCAAARDHNELECLRLHEQLLPLHRLMFVESNPIPVKWALNRMGLMSSELRMPLTLLSREHHQELEQVLRTLECI